MAPEQTGGRPIDTRVDVYALGALLYELSCGRPPIALSDDPLETLRRIRDDTPPPVSRLRAQVPELALAPRSLVADLDCILARALEKDPGRRYPTAAALAQDLRRLLNREPIDARYPSVAYRAARFAQRNRILVGSLALVSLAIMLGIAGLAAGLLEAKRQHAEATAQRDTQQEINRFLTEDMLGGASPNVLGQNATALDLLHRAAKKVDLRFADRPLIAAAVHHTLGTSFLELGAFDDAEHHLQRALELRRAASGPDAPDTVRTEIAAASLLARRERLADAETALTTAVGRARRILGTNDLSTYDAINDLGSLKETMDKAKEALPLLNESLEGRTRLLGPRDPLVLFTTSNLAQAYDRLGETDHSLELDLQALKVADSLDDPPRLTLIGLCNNIGATYQDLNKDADAAPYLRRAAALSAQFLGPDSPDTLTIQANLASLEAELGNPERGAELYDTVIKARTRIMGPDTYDTMTARYGYWNCLWIGKRFDEAAEGYRQMLPDVERALGERHWLAIQTRLVLARALYDGGRLDEALPFARQAQERFTAIYGPDHARTARAAALVKSITDASAPNAGK
jgi:tetratricopeptide (TPR) repeat protein